jgi:ubiquinone/menaquinone biosynthesis C-methylase UbiE
MKKRFNGISTIDYRIGEAENLPIEDECVDYVFANMFLHHVENPSVVIKEMERTLKPAGVLVITDLDKHDFKFLKAEHYDRWMGFRREDIRHWFIEAGLEEVKVDCASESCCAQSSCGRKYASIGIFVALGEKSSG